MSHKKDRPLVKCENCSWFIIVIDKNTRYFCGNGHIASEIKNPNEFIDCGLFSGKKSVMEGELFGNQD